MGNSPSQPCCARSHKRVNGGVSHAKDRSANRRHNLVLGCPGRYPGMKHMSAAYHTKRTKAKSDLPSCLSNAVAVLPVCELNPAGWTPSHPTHGGKALRLYRSTALLQPCLVSAPGSSMPLPQSACMVNHHLSGCDLGTIQRWQPGHGIADQHISLVYTRFHEKASGNGRSGRSHGRPSVDIDCQARTPATKTETSSERHRCLCLAVVCSGSCRVHAGAWVAG
jgi:hypothetical protein